jgi:2-amino-4-hydroxy-6-hydroxymethyldihydropteridine diphosphokinase
LNEALALLAPVVQDLHVSTFCDTDPVGVGDQPRFLNAAAVGQTALSARALLDNLLGIERQLGRTRPFPGAARTLDLDLILYGDSVIDEPGLLVPHPRFRDRAFVLKPLAEVAAGWIDPVTGRTIGELASAVE